MLHRGAWEKTGGRGQERQAGPPKFPTCFGAGKREKKTGCRGKKKQGPAARGLGKGSSGEHLRTCEGRETRYIKKKEGGVPANRSSDCLIQQGKNVGVSANRPHHCRGRRKRVRRSSWLRTEPPSGWPLRKATMPARRKKKKFMTPRHAGPRSQGKNQVFSNNDISASPGGGERGERNLFGSHGGVKGKEGRRARKRRGQRTKAGRLKDERRPGRT